VERPVDSARRESSIADFSAVFLLHTAEEAEALLPVMAAMAAVGTDVGALTSGSAVAVAKNCPHPGVPCIPLQHLEKKIKGDAWTPRMLRRGDASVKPVATSFLGPEPLPDGVDPSYIYTWQARDGSCAFVLKEQKTIVGMMPKVQLVVTGMVAASQLTFARAFSRAGARVVGYKAGLTRNISIEKVFLPWVRQMLLATPVPAQLLKEVCSETWPGGTETWPAVHAVGIPQSKAYPSEQIPALRDRLSLPAASEGHQVEAGNPTWLYIAKGEREESEVYSQSWPIFLSSLAELQGRVRVLIFYPSAQSHGAHTQELVAAGLQGMVTTVPRDVSLEAAIALSDWVLSCSTTSTSLMALSLGKPAAHIVATCNPSPVRSPRGGGITATPSGRNELLGAEHIIAGFCPVFSSAEEFLDGVGKQGKRFDTSKLAEAGIQIYDFADRFVRLLDDL